MRGSRETTALPCSAASLTAPPPLLSERNKGGRLELCELFPQLSPALARWQTPCVARSWCVSQPGEAREPLAFWTFHASS